MLSFLFQKKEFRRNDKIEVSLVDTRFADHKKEAIAKLEDALEKNQVDSDVLSFLNVLNEEPMYYTTSSCSGRIVVMQLPDIGNKKQAVFLGKWHREIERKEVSTAIARFSDKQLWFLAQPPIFHIGCKSVEDANLLLQIGVSCGFKHSGVKTFSDKIIVELCSTERMDVPLAIENKIYVEETFITLLVEMANRVIRRGKEKIYRLEASLR